MHVLKYRAYPIDEVERSLFAIVVGENFPAVTRRDVIDS